MCGGKLEPCRGGFSATIPLKIYSWDLDSPFCLSLLIHERSLHTQRQMRNSSLIFLPSRPRWPSYSPFTLLVCHFHTRLSPHNPPSFPSYSGGKRFSCLVQGTTSPGLRAHSLLILWEPHQCISLFSLSPYSLPPSGVLSLCLQICTNLSLLKKKKKSTPPALFPHFSFLLTGKQMVWKLLEHLWPGNMEGTVKEQEWARKMCAASHGTDPCAFSLTKSNRRRTFSVPLSFYLILF